MTVRPHPLAHAPVAAVAVGADAGVSVPWASALELVVGESKTRETPADVDWDAHMQRYGRRVVVSLLARGVLPERAKELAQDAWFRVIQAHRRGKLPELKVPGIVIKQAAFLLHDDRRRSSSRYAHEPIDEAAQPQPDEREFEAQLAARHQLRQVQAVIKDAHPNARRVFEMMYGGDAHSASEIAEALGLSVQRVRQIGCELRKTLRRELQTESGRRS